MDQCRRLSQHVRGTQLNVPGRDLLEFSNLQELVQRGVRIPVEQLTKPEQVRPWVGQEHYDFLPQQHPTTGWQTGHASQSGAMTEPLQTHIQPVNVSATLSRHASNADSGYVSLSLSTKREGSDFDTMSYQYVEACHPSSFDECLFPSSTYSQVARTVVSETLAGSSGRKETQKAPSLAPCPECGRPPKNHSDARKHAETHAKRHKCGVPNCGRKEGFATLNDLERHRKSVHGAHPTVGNPAGYICQACVQQSQGKENKFWPRRDNFKAHIKRKHGDWREADLLEQSKSLRPDDAMTADLEERSVMSLQDRSRALSGAGQDENIWYHAQPYSCSPQPGHPQHQEDLPDMFNSSHNQEDALAAVGSHALDGITMYDIDGSWPLLGQNFASDGALTTNLMQDATQYPVSHSQHEIKQEWCIGGEAKQTVTEPAHHASATFDRKPPRYANDTIPPRKCSSFQLQLNGEHQCPFCSKIKKRECDLKKHMKRHTRPYGCTFPSCNKTFGSRNDWKRHETSQHPLPEQWKCCRAKLPTYGGQVCQRRPWRNIELMKKHLQSDEHGVKDQRTIQQACDQARMGKGGFGGWWCGFCVSIIRPSSPSASSQQHSHLSEDIMTTAWEQRMKHVGDHFDKEFKEIADWVCVEANKKRRYISVEEQRRAKIRARRGWIEEEEEEEDLPVWEPLGEEMFDMRLEREEVEMDAESVSDDDMI